MGLSDCTCQPNECLNGSICSVKSKFVVPHKYFIGFVWIKDFFLFFIVVST